MISKGNILAKKSYATGKGLEVGTPGEKTTAIVHVCNDVGRTYMYPAPIKSLTCELTSESNHDKIKGTVKKIEAGKYEIGYRATNRGRHKLHIKVEGEHIKGSPFPVTVKIPVQKLGTPIRCISGIKQPWGIANNHKGELIVVECGGNCVSIFSSKGEKIHSFGSNGVGNGQFREPCGVAVTDNGDILVVDGGNNRIQRFSTDGRYITAVGTRGTGQLQFQSPVGIKTHPLTKRIYVGDRSNNRIQILNPDLSYFNSIGSHGGGPGQLSNPWDIAFDSANNVYVTDPGSRRIQYLPKMEVS